MRNYPLSGLTTPTLKCLYLTDQIMAQELPLKHALMTGVSGNPRESDFFRSSNVVSTFLSIQGLYPECPAWSEFIQRLVDEKHDQDAMINHVYQDCVRLIFLI